MTDPAANEFTFTENSKIEGYIHGISQQKLPKSILCLRLQRIVRPISSCPPKCLPWFALMVVVSMVLGYLVTPYKAIVVDLEVPMTKDALAQEETRVQEELLNPSGVNLVPEEEDQTRTENSEKESEYAPRTDPSIPYNNLDCSKRYLLYNPYGGMTNQIMDLHNIMIIAKRTNRILYLPMLGLHSNTLEQYRHLKRNVLFPADRILDVPQIHTYVPVVPLNTTMKGMIEKVQVKCGKNNVRLVINLHGKDSTGTQLVRSAHYPTVTLVHMEIAGLYSPRFFAKEDMAITKRSVTFSPYLRRLSHEIAVKVMGDKFYAIHGRLGDYKDEWKHDTSREAFVETSQFSHWDKKLPLYLATDEPRSAFFNELRKRMKVLTLKDLDDKDVQGYLSLFPVTSTMQGDMAGVLDKLICIQAVDFMGSWFSTFTHEIIFMRQHLKYVFPEAYRWKKLNMSFYSEEPIPQLSG